METTLIFTQKRDRDIMIEENQNEDNQVVNAVLETSLEPATTLPKIEQTYSDLFKEVTKLNENNIIKRPNCKFCQHPIRREAESKWEQVSGSFAPVKKMFEKWEKDNPGHAPMNYQNLRSHLTTHYAKQEQKMWLKEYANDCRAYMNHKVSQDHRFELLHAIFEKQLFGIGSNPTLDPIKQSDQMVKLGKMLLDIDECQAKLRGDLKPVNVITERFHKIWVHVINNQEDDIVRRKLQLALDNFQGCFEDNVLIE